jgi:starch phosphorylase
MEFPMASQTQTALPEVKFKVDVSVDELTQLIIHYLHQAIARGEASAKPHDWLESVTYAVKTLITDRFIKTQMTHLKQDVKRAYYLSMEYLVGRLLENNLHNLNLFEKAQQALASLDVDIHEVVEQGHDMGLGNGGLGRLAACFLDSLATLNLPAVGYGIHYEFGLFRQEIKDGQQVERPDNWNTFGNPWQICRPDYIQEVHLYGHIEHYSDEQGKTCSRWVGTRTLLGVPWDIPVVGYGGKTVNFLRLWESRALEEFNFEMFNAGSYADALKEKVMGEIVSKVLYPDDATAQGKELRLVQQYFFVSCSLQDVIRRFKINQQNWDVFPDRAAIQLNDTHPAIAIAELMRLLVDTEGLEWNHAWGICRQVFTYTNHTLLPEALEVWPVSLFSNLLPRHLEIIYRINLQFLEQEVDQHWPADINKRGQLSIIDESGEKMVRMAYLSIVASHKVNGVAALHTELLKQQMFPEFNELYPDKFINVTNGITPRRWLLSCNPALAKLINSKLGDRWLTDLEQLRGLEIYADDADFQRQFMAIKQANKQALTRVIHQLCGVKVSADAIFDVQIKRLHEYKRQHLNLLHILYLYRRLLKDPGYDMHPRVFIFAAKAAPGYKLAKTIIYAINKVADRINNDGRINNRLKVVFLPDYRVSLAEKIIPAADVSEQISLAGLEASGTGNMKLALNGALTIGTLDGANVEIAERVGEDNLFIFGLTVKQVAELRQQGYRPQDYYQEDTELHAILDWLGSDYFTANSKQSLAPLRDALMGDGKDYYMALADFAAYKEAQQQVDKAYRDPQGWARKAILNCARVGYFSSDRAITQYAEQIWQLSPQAVPG